MQITPAAITAADVTLSIMPADTQEDVGDKHMFPNYQASPDSAYLECGSQHR